eukprot:2450087-Amphidinium_carterae.1
MQVPSWTLVALQTLEQYAMPIFGGDIQRLASQVAKETVEVVQQLEATGKDIVLHCIGHSMGGVAVRGALPELFSKLPDIEPGTYMALSSPHIGRILNLPTPPKVLHKRRRSLDDQNQGARD